MRRFAPHLAALALTLTALLAAGLAAPAPATAQDAPATPADVEDMQREIKRLQAKITEQQVEIDVLREQLAESQLRASDCERARTELEQFIEDSQTLGDAYEEYQQVKQIAEAEAERERIEEARARYEQIKAERKRRYQEARAARAKRQAERDRERMYRDAGFSPIGLDVYASRFSFYYQTRDATRTRIDWRSGFGHYLRLYPDYDIDFSTMTISGSVLNASDEVRNIGVAIAFFDEQGAQVGHETIQVSNARPDVPYPFTAELKMALDRPFDSSSTYVLYADPIDGDQPGGTSYQP